MRKDKNRKSKKAKKNTGKIIFLIIILLIIGIGAYTGYFIQKNGGGLQGLLATVLRQDVEKLEDLDTINVLILRSK